MWNILNRSSQQVNTNIARSSHTNQSNPLTQSIPSQTSDSSRPIAGKRDFCTRRLIKEFNDLTSHPVASIRLLSESPIDLPTTTSADSSSSTGNALGSALLLGATGAPPRFVEEWTVEIIGAPDTLYDQEVFTLRFRFDEKYPMTSPEVVFIGTPPVHPHIYSNGHICLSILYDGWSPALGVMSVCLSLVSILSSCEKKEKPTDDQQYVSICGPRVSPKSMHWVFHDDNV